MQLLRILILLTILSSSYSGFAQKRMQKQILGKWLMESVYDGETDVSEQHNPKQNRWVKFNRNGSFESDGDPYGYNDGTWELNTKTAVLFLDSNLEGDDSEWNMSIKGNTMTWTGIGTPRQERFKVVLRKEE